MASVSDRACCRTCHLKLVEAGLIFGLPYQPAYIASLRAAPVFHGLTLAVWGESGTGASPTLRAQCPLRSHMYLAVHRACLRDASASRAPSGRSLPYLRLTRM